MRKKGFRILVAIVLLFAISIPQTSLAASKSADKLLASRGYPEDIIKLMSEKVKNDIVSHDNFRYAGSSTYIKDMEKSINSINADTHLSPQGTISSSDLSFTCVCTTWTDNGIKYLHIDTIYKWATRKPTWRLTDQIGITWDSSKFQVMDGEYFFNSEYNIGGIMKYETSRDARELNESNIIGDFNLLAAADVNSGDAVVLLRVKPGVKAPANTVVYFKYGHAMIVPTITMGIDNSGLGIGISGSVNVDSLAKSKSVTCSW